MARNLKPGDNVNGYTIIEQLNVGGMAVSYSAKTGSGDKVFLKQYKSPSVTLDWYRDYVAYQKEIKRRVEASPILKTMTVRFVDTFEAKAGPLTYFQAFEFVKAGEEFRADSDAHCRQSEHRFLGTAVAVCQGDHDLYQWCPHGWTCTL